MKRLIIVLILSSVSLLHSSEIDKDALLDQNAAAIISNDSAEIINEMENILITSGVAPQTLQAKGDTLAHRAVRMGKVAVRRLLGMMGIDYTKKNAQGMTALELARSIDHQDAVKLLSVDLMAEFETGDAFESKLIDYIQECLVPEGNVEESFENLRKHIEAHRGTISSLGTYYPKFLQGESLGHALEQYNPELYSNRNRILDILEPARPQNPYKSSRSNDEEVVCLIREYLNHDRNTTFAELQMVFKAWPISVDCYQALDEHKTLGVAIDESNDEQLIALCSATRIDTSTWATAATDTDRSRFIELALRCLIDQDQEINTKLDYYLRFSQTSESLCAQYELPIKADEQNLTMRQFLKGLSPELFPRRNELEKRLSIVYLIERKDVAPDACLVQLTKDVRACPSLKPVLEYALTQYKGPALTFEGTDLTSGKPTVTPTTQQAGLGKKDLRRPKKPYQVEKLQKTAPKQSQASFLSTTTGKLLLVGVTGLALYWLTALSKKSLQTAKSEIR